MKKQKRFVKIKKQEKEESLDKLVNIPNELSILRVIMTFVIIYLIIIEAKISLVILIFVLAALTDFLDGQIARRFNQVTEFGRKADMIADRFLWLGTAIAFVIAFGLKGRLEAIHGVQFLFIMSREIVSAPLAIYSLIKQRPIPHAIFIAKLTTFLQGFAIPLIILSIYFPWITYISLPLSVIILGTGTASGIQYIKDVSR